MIEKILVRLRQAYYQKCLWYVGKKVGISSGCILAGKIILMDGVCLGPNTQLYARRGGRIYIGRRTGINSNVMINADINGTIVIESDVMIAPNVVIRASGHVHDRPDKIMGQGHVAGSIHVCAGAWIGSNCTIIQGVTIGRGAVVGACSLVNRDVAENSMVGGVPAMILRGA